MDRYIKHMAVKERSLHDGKQAYRARFSVGSAFHIVVFRIEEQMETGRYALGTFLDADGAFNATSYHTKFGERRGMVF